MVGLGTPWIARTLYALFSLFFLVRVYLIYQSQHVEQLLRTLNLNSPAPPPQKPAIDLNVDTSPSSPDFSPASVSSALLTPTDLSPVRSFDIKFPAQYEHGQHQPYFSQSSLLFENGSPGKHQNTLAAHSPYPPFSHSNLPSNAFPFFEPFTEPPTPAPINSVHIQYHPPSPSPLPHSLYSSPLPPRRMESARPSPMDWRLTQQLQQQPASTHPDWRLACEKDYNFGINTQEDTLRSSFSYQKSTASQAFQSSHEVRHLLVFL
jgi:pumilio RNA-binding family